MDLHSIPYWVDENVEAPVKKVIKLGPEQKQKHKNKQGGPVYDLRS